MHKKLQQLKPYFLLLLVVFIAYLPLSTFYFGMKNDAFSDNFPNKFFLSEALHAGMMPLWNPYMNFGFPIYADPGFAFWNPVTWLFSIIGYSAYILTVEVLLYIYLSGIFMFRLCRYLKFAGNISVAVAVMYMCSGFFVGCLQYINFLTSAAFLPLLILNYLECLQKPNYKNSFFLSISGYFVFVGGHPAIPIATLYFLFILTLLLVFIYREYRNSLKQKFFFIIVSVILFVLLASPALYSYLNVLQAYSRDTSQQSPPFINAGFDPSSYISFLFPLSTICKQFFSNDVAMRNGYISIIGIIATILCIKHRNRLSMVFFITGLLMLIFCIGGNFKILLYQKLPLLNFVRINGEFRVFTEICFCVSAGFSLNQLLISNSFRQYFLKTLKILLLVVIVLIIIFFFIVISTIHDTWIHLNFQTDFFAKIKWLLDNGSLSFFLLCSACLSFIFLNFAILFFKKRRFFSFTCCVIADMIINSILYLPVTGIGQVTLFQIQKIYASSPKGIPIPPLIPINKIGTLDAKTTGLIGNITYYNKKIGTQKLTDYPSYFKNTDSFFSSTLRQNIIRMPYIFLKSNFSQTENITNIIVTKFTPTHIQVTVNSRKADSLVLLQNYYKFWKAYNNNALVSIQPAYITFMSVPVREGNNKIDFFYNDHLLPLFLCLSLLTFVIAIFFLIRIKQTEAHHKGAMT